MKSCKLVIILVIIFSNIYLFAEEYSFDIEEFEKKNYEYIIDLSSETNFVFYDKSSSLYDLIFFNKETQHFSDSYNLSLQAEYSYDYKSYKFKMEFLEELLYGNDDKFDDNFYLYELYISKDFSTKYNFFLGKKTIKWGTGYIWNPVSYVGRQKNINDVEGSLEGFYLFEANFIKSLSGFIDNFAINTAFLFKEKDLNEEFSSIEKYNFFIKNYFLIAGLDLDLVQFYEGFNLKKIGVDFSKNILENWAIHGEYSYEKNMEREVIEDNFEFKNETKNLNHYLVGTRILLPSNTTIIFEYLHNEKGYNQNEFEKIVSTINDAIENNPAAISQLKQFQKEFLTDQFLMRDYFYIKFSQPEPFDLLYSNISFFSLFNIVDKSNMCGGEVSYSKFTNWNFNLKYNQLFGKKYSEFGEKNNSSKLMLSLDYLY